MTTVAALYTPSKKWAPEPWPEPTPPAPGFTFDRGEPAVRQSADWTCSCASMAWVMNALGVDAPDGGKWNEWTGVDELRRICGYLRCHPTTGWPTATGRTSRRSTTRTASRVQRQAVGWPDLAYLCELGVGQVGGARLYHWMGVRGYDGAVFQLANPAYSYKGIEDDLDPNEWNTWGGWTCVMVIGVQ